MPLQILSLARQARPLLAYRLLFPSCLRELHAVRALRFVEPMVRRSAIEVRLECLRDRPPEFSETAVLSMAVLARLAASAGEGLVGKGFALCTRGCAVQAPKSDARRLLALNHDRQCFSPCLQEAESLFNLRQAVPRQPIQLSFKAVWMRRPRSIAIAVPVAAAQVRRAPPPEKRLAREGRNLVRVVIEIKTWEMTAFYTS